MGRRKLSDQEVATRKLEMREYQKEYRKRNKQILTAKKLEARTKAKEEGIIAYGAKCSCCGETNKSFLTIEHKNGRNKATGTRTGKDEWAKLKARGWPDYVTLHCFNCNCAKGIYGSCPHTWESNE